MRPTRKIALASVLGVALATAALGTTLVANADPPKAGYAPDPPIVLSSKHWVFKIEVNSGAVSLGDVRAAMSQTPEGTPRVLGRWAIELYAGKELVDRVRFNVPGMGDAPRNDDKRVLKKPSMDRITTHFEVRIADNSRATSAKLVDRATGDETPIPWPLGSSSTPTPSAAPSAPPADAGAPAPSAPRADAGAPNPSPTPKTPPAAPPKASASPGPAPSKP